METLSVSEFKAKALGVLDRVARTGEGVVVTKRGKPIVKVIPFFSDSEALVPGSMQGSVLEEEDIVSPLGADLWDAAR